ncbi:uncharacterized protein LOC111037738 [Myzus persicae]|uniref:uncharacterized protein LOC111037738 n=1 Tax=Myzus persicae TaxID=13164 RepID=UPI000B92FF7D|nr:uncharacterized protein LOC111037738 [Myzus persicae]
MNSGSDNFAKRKELKPLLRSGYRDGELYKSTVPNENLNLFCHSYNGEPSSSDSDEDSEDDDEEEAYDYISLFQVWLNFLFPRAFRIQPVHRWVKSAHSVSDLRERSTGKILSPVGRCSLFPEGVFVQSTTEKDVTKICFPGAQETFTAPSRPSRVNKN